MTAASPRPTATSAEAALRRRLSRAGEHCAERGAQLTAQRTEVLELLLRRGGSAKAYDLQGDMQARHGRIAPTTVYRALDFLQEHHLVHKVDATNTYVVCDHASHAHPTLLLICTRCGSIEELHDAHAAAPLLDHVTERGFAPQAVEIKSLCGPCQAA